MENNKPMLPVEQKLHTSLMQLELSRPTLAKLNEDYPKVKTVISAFDIEDLINFLIRILNIKTSSQQEQDDLDFQIPLIFDFIKSKFGSLTIPEIKEAFKMYVAKCFPEIKVFRLLDCISVGEVLTAYINFRADTLRPYSQKKAMLQNQIPEMTEQAKEEIIKSGVNRVFLEYRETKKLQDSTEYLFDFLVEKTLIKSATTEKLIQYYQNKLKEGEAMVKKELQNKMVSSDSDERKKAIQDFKDFNLGNNSKSMIYAKRIILIEFFDKQISLGKTIIF